MQLVGGHQRLAILDALERRTDYELDVSLVELDEKTAREQCTFLNNQYTMGTFDLTRLEELLGTIDIEHCGFAKADLEVLLPTFERAPTPAAIEQATEIQRVSAEIQTAHAAARAAKPKATREEMRAKRKEIRARMSAAQPEGVDVEFFTVLTFASPAARNAFLARLGIDAKERYISGAVVRAAIEGTTHESQETQQDAVPAV